MVSYLLDPILMETILNSLALNQVSTFSNGDISTLFEKTIGNFCENSMQRYGITNQKATYKRYVTMFGLKIFEVTAWIRYRHNGSQVLSIDSSNIFTCVNLNSFGKVAYSTQIT